MGKAGASAGNDLIRLAKDEKDNVVKKSALDSLSHIAGPDHAVRLSSGRPGVARDHGGLVPHPPQVLDHRGPPNGPAVFGRRIELGDDEKPAGRGAHGGRLARSHRGKSPQDSDRADRGRRVLRSANRGAERPRRGRGQDKHATRPQGRRRSLDASGTAITAGCGQAKCFAGESANRVRGNRSQPSIGLGIH